MFLLGYSWIKHQASSASNSFWLVPDGCAWKQMLILCLLTKVTLWYSECLMLTIKPWNVCMNFRCCIKVCVSGRKKGDGAGRIQTNAKTNENPRSDLNDDLTKRILIHIHKFNWVFNLFSCPCNLVLLVRSWEKKKYYHSIMFSNFVSKQKFVLYNQIIKDLWDSRYNIKGHTFISQ